MITNHDLFWHFLGSFILSIIFYFCIGFYSMIVVFFGGVLIEVYDYYFVRINNDLQECIKDLILDVLGVLLALAIILFFSGF